MNNKQKNDFSHMFESYDTEDEAIRAIVEFTVQKEMGSEKEEKPYLDHTYNFSFPGGKATVDKNSKNNFKAMSDENLEKNIRDALSTADMTTKKPKTEFDKTVAGQKSLELLNQQRTKMSSEIEQDVQSKKGTIKQIMDNNRQIYQKNELLRSGNLSPEKKVKLNDELDALQISSKNLNKSLNFKPLSRDTIRKRVKERVENEYLPRALYLLDQEDITIDKKSKFLVPLVAKVYNSPSFGPNEQKALKNEDMSKFIDEIGNHNNPKDVNGKKSNGINHRNLSTALLMEKVTKPEFLTKKLTFDMQPTDVAPHLREGKVLSTKDQNVFNDYVENSDDFKPFALETLSKKEQNSNFGKKELSALKKLGLDSGFAKPDSGFKNTNKNALNQQPKSI
ncbi:MAG: hypothetical protein GY793_11860, partial [Proteobacteria bacterium]|nr:hypothetical protein [Pseudomonadota bacterium]